jgi:predicted RNA-binding protein with RPS1 domain
MTTMTIKHDWTRIGADEAKPFATENLLSSSRTLPVVAITTPPGEQHPLIDPDQLAKELAGKATVVLLETGEATWALSAALPKRLDVYGGAARIWWPGLTRESDPFDHVLLLIRDERSAANVHERILSAILGGDAEAGRWSQTRPPQSMAPRAAPQPRRDRAVKVVAPDPWRRIAEEYQPGDVVPARVFRLDPRFALVELLPGAGVMVPLAEIDYTWVRDPSEVLTVGERVNVQLLELDPTNRRGLASIKRALLATPRAGIALRPGDPPYLGAETVEETDAQLRRAVQREREVSAKQAEELEAALDDRQRLAQQCEELKVQASTARKELKSAEDRIRFLEAQAAELDPLASETSFLAAVRVEYARRFDEADRQRYPLQKMRVGRSFLESVRNLHGIDIDKVVEVCAQVACNRAHEIQGRYVHELTEGVAGRSTLRSTDGAKAWRCALQVGSPSARRLHWWSIPQKDGATIEFASVAVHDEFSIPV